MITLLVARSTVDAINVGENRTFVGWWGAWTGSGSTIHDRTLGSTRFRDLEATRIKGFACSACS